MRTQIYTRGFTASLQFLQAHSLPSRHRVGTSAVSQDSTTLSQLCTEPGTAPGNATSHYHRMAVSDQLQSVPKANRVIKLPAQFLKAPGADIYSYGSDHSFDKNSLTTASVNWERALGNQSPTLCNLLSVIRLALCTDYLKLTPSPHILPGLEL